MKLKLISKVISIIVVTLIIFSGYDLGVFFNSTSNIAIAEGEDKAQLVPDCVPDSAEKRNEHVKHLPEYEDEHTVAFENEDGSQTFYVFQSPVKYKDENGDLQYFDNSIVEIDDKTKSIDGMKYTTKNSNTNLFLPEDFSSDKKIKLESENDWITFKPNLIQESKETSVQNVAAELVASKRKASKMETALYKSVFDETTDIQYTPSSRGVKEEIVLNTYNGKNVFEFIMITSGLLPELQEDMSVIFLDPETKDVKAVIDSVYVKDSFTGDRLENDGHDSFDSIVNIKQIENTPDTYLYTIEVNKKFLEKSDTVYPVIVDPSVTWHYNDVNYSDTQISQKLPNQLYYQYSNLRVGYSSDYYKVRSCVQFPITSLVSLNPTGITSAYYYAYEDLGYTSNAYVGVFKIDNTWNETNTTWNNPPPVSATSPVHGWKLVNEEGYQKFVITNLVSNWLYYYDEAPGGYANNGFMLKMQTETSSYYRRFISSDYNYGSNPYVEINYTNTDVYPPNPVSSVTLNATQGNANDGTCRLGVTFPLTSDMPLLNPKGIGGYKIYLNGQYAQTVGANPTFPINTINSQPWLVQDNSTYTVSVVAFDKNATPLESTAVTSNTVTALDRSAPIWNDNAKLIINGSETNNWTNGTHPSFSWGEASPDGGAINCVKWSTSELAGYNLTNCNVTPGSVNIDLSSISSDGEHNIYIRAFDNASVSNQFGGTGNYSPALVGVYRKDTAPPSAVLTSPEVNDASFYGTLTITGNVTDYNPNITTSGIDHWVLYYGRVIQGQQIEYTELINGETNVVSHPWDISSLVDNGKYSIRLRAYDNAGNYLDTTRTFIKSNNATPVTKNLQVNSPSSDVTLTVPQTVVDYERVGGGTADLSNATLFADGNVVDDNAGDGLNIDVIDETKFPEGSNHSFFVRAFDDISDKYIYSCTSHSSYYYDYFNTTDQIGQTNNVNRANGKVILAQNGGAYSSAGYLTSNFTGSELSVDSVISEAKLTVSENKPTGTDIVYNISNDGGATWRPIIPGETVAFSNNGASNQVVVKAQLSTGNASVTPELLWWRVEIISVVSGQMFTVQLVDIPVINGVLSDINYTNKVTWNGSTINEITYNVYRGTNAEFTKAQAIRLNVPDANNRGVSQPFFYDNLIDYGETVYYKVTAVVNVGSEENPVYRESMLSVPQFTTFVEEDELNKRLGLEDYWQYAGFRTGSGSGSVNVSSGNLVYQSADFVYPSPFLAMVFRRTYNSDSTSSTTMGYGWDFSFNTTLLYERENITNEIISVILKDGDGSIHKFTRNGDEYTAPNGVFMTLKKNEDGSWLVRRSDNIEYVYDKNMLLTNFREPNGNYIHVDYLDNGYIKEVKSYTKSLDGSQEYNTGLISFEYYAYQELGHEPVTPEEEEIVRKNNLAGLIMQIVDPAGRIYTYDYDSNRRLVKRELLVDTDGNKYEELFAYTDEKLSSVTNGRVNVPADRAITQFTYNTTGKLDKIIYPDVTEDTRISYPTGVNYPAGQTVVQNYKNIQSQDQLVNQTKFDFNIFGVVTKTTDPNNHEIGYQLNDDYQITEVRTNKDSLAIQYNSSDTITTIAYVQSGYAKGNISQVTDPLGHTTVYTYSNESIYQYHKPDSVTQQLGYEADETTIRSLKTDYDYDDYGNLLSTSKFSVIGSTVTSLDRISSTIYHTNGMVQETEDEYGNATHYYYFDNNDTHGEYGWLKQVVAPNGVTTSEVIQYDSQGNPTLIRDAEGAYTQSEYDYIGRLKKTYLPDPATGEVSTSFVENEYDFNSNLVKTIDAEGKIVINEYDSMDRPIKTSQVWYEDNEFDEPTEYSIFSTTNYLYKADGSQYTKKTDPSGVMSIEYYDRAGRLTRVETGSDNDNDDDLDGTSVDYLYDAAGNMTRVTDKLGRYNTAQYDKLGRTTSTITDPTGKNIVVSTTYDFVGNVISSTDGNLNITRNTYDLLSRLVKVTQYLDTVPIETTYRYDLEKIVSVNGQSKNCIVNEVKDAEGGVKWTCLNELGQAIKEIDFGRVTTTINNETDVSDRICVYKEYDDNGQLVKVIYNDGSIEQYRYNYRAQMYKKLYGTSETENVNVYVYNENGNLRSVESNRHEQYQENGQTKNSYSKQATVYNYNVVNRLSSYIQTFYFSNDGVYDSGTANLINYDYFNNGNVKKVQYEVVEIDNTFDPANPTIELTPAEISYTYNDEGKLSQTFFDNDTSDAVQRKLVQDYAYLSNGALDFAKTYRDFKNGGTGYIKKQTQYDTANRLEKIVYYDNTTLREQYDYVYDKNNNITNETQTVNYPDNEFIEDAVHSVTTITNAYDDIGRLKHVTNAFDDIIDNSNDETTNTDYTYDDVGNRLTQDMGDDKSVLRYNYDKFNKLNQIDSKDHGDADSEYEKSVDYDYDALGRQIAENNWQMQYGTLQKASWSVQTYNAAGEMFSSAQRDQGNPNGTPDYYFYNADGKRIRKNMDAVGTNYYYSGGALLFTTRSDMNSKTTENILTPGGTIIASQRFDGDFTNKWYTYNYDIRGSVTNILSPEGSLIKGYTYDSFGNAAATDNAFSNEVQFTGAVADGGGIYYMNSRYYNANTGRFLSQDSYSGNAYEPWTQHLYTYCGNNPVNMVDPTGHCPLCFCSPGTPAYEDFKNAGIKPCSRYLASYGTSGTGCPNGTAVVTGDSSSIEGSSNTRIFVPYDQVPQFIEGLWDIEKHGSSEYINNFFKNIGYNLITDTVGKQFYVMGRSTKLSEKVTSGVSYAFIAIDTLTEILEYSQGEQWYATKEKAKDNKTGVIYSITTMSYINLWSNVGTMNIGLSPGMYVDTSYQELSEWTNYPYLN